MTFFIILLTISQIIDLDFTTLYTELNKILGAHLKWFKVELRNYKINSLYEI